MVTTRKHMEETGTGENKEQLQEKQQANKQEECPVSKKAKGAEGEGSQGGQGDKQEQEEEATKGIMPEKYKVGGEEEEEEEKEAVGEGEQQATEGLPKKGTMATAKGKKVAEEMKKGKAGRSQTIKSRLGLEIGSTAPDFALSNEEGETVALKDFKGKHVAIYFYNKDDTPVVTRGCMAFTKIFPEMEKIGIPLLFIGPDRYEGEAPKGTRGKDSKVYVVFVFGVYSSEL